MRCYAMTDIGRVRKQNEDFVKADIQSGLFIVADGMGGHQAGEIASREAAERFRTALAGSGDLSGTLLTDALVDANRQIHQLALEHEDYRGMGTTFTAAAVKDMWLWIVHVGDSRAYLVRDAAIRQLTEDHTVPQMLFRMGKLTEGEVQGHPDSHVLSKAVGTQPQLSPDLVEVGLQTGDVLLLCSDGLTNRVIDGEILDAVMNHENPEDVVNRLVDLANERGGSDNISLICVKFDEDKE